LITTRFVNLATKQDTKLL